MMRTFHLTQKLAVGFAAAAALGLVLGSVSANAKESTATDCFIQLQSASGQPLGSSTTCKDCDPTCDRDSSNSTPNKQCTFRVRACTNATASGCTTRELKRAVVTPKKLAVATQLNGTSSACGAFTDLVVKVKKNGRRAGKLRIVGAAAASGRPRASDRDVANFVCEPRPEGESCPTTTTSTTTTTTTTSTSTTTTTLSTCVGTVPNGTLDLGEQCDDGNTNDGDACTNNCKTARCGDGSVLTGTEECDGVNASACGSGETCMPAGSLSECTCKTCTAISPEKELVFRTGTGTSLCGDAGFLTPALDPVTGSVSTEATQMTPASSFALGSGCLHIGGGNSSVGGGNIPDGSETRFRATQNCEGEVLLQASSGDSLSCTTGSGPGKACINVLSAWPNLQACTNDSGCPLTGPSSTESLISCVAKPNCMFGAPLPIVNGGTSTCVINTFDTDAQGSVNQMTGEARISIPLKSHTFLTGNEGSPCPKCQNGTCTYGLRGGQACSGGVGSLETTIECPPDPAGGAYLPEFTVTLSPLTTGTTTVQRSDGIYCPNQQTFSAFGTQSARTDDPLKVIEIEQTGSPAGDLSGGTAMPAILSAVFCIPATGATLIDGAADLAGPGAVSLPGTLQLRDVP